MKLLASGWHIAVAADQGMRRTMNEDRAVRVAIGTAPCWAEGVVVADGMGGAAGGERASRLVADTFVDRLRDWQVQADRLGPRFGDAVRPYLVDLADGAHRRIAAAAREDTALEGMGSTLTFVAVTEGRYFGIHVGDSRAYLVRGGRARQLTTDQVHDNGSLLQAVGHGDIDPEFLSGPLGPGDTVLVCSDGLTKHLDEIEIGSIVARGGRADLIAAELIAVANQRGGVDNIAVGVILGSSAPVASAPPPARRTRLVIGLALASVSLLTATVAAFLAYRSSGAVESGHPFATVNASGSGLAPGGTPNANPSVPVAGGRPPLSAASRGTESAAIRRPAPRTAVDTTVQAADRGGEAAGAGVVPPLDRDSVTPRVIGSSRPKGTNAPTQPLRQAPLRPPECSKEGERRKSLERELAKTRKEASSPDGDGSRRQVDRTLRSKRLGEIEGKIEALADSMKRKGCVLP